jgi:hypothetical protein
MKNPWYISLNHIFPDQGHERMEFFFSCVPICSQWVPHDVLQVLNVFLKGVLNSTSLLSHTHCPKLSPSHLYKREALHPHIEMVILRSLQGFLFFFFGDGPIKMAHADPKT